MVKKLIAVSVLFLSLTIVSNSAWAVSCVSVLAPDIRTDDSVTSPRYYAVGNYSISGSLTLTVNFPDLMSATIKFPKLENLIAAGLQESFLFKTDYSNDPNNIFENGLLSDDLIYNNLGLAIGSWVQTSCTNFTVDYTTLASSLLDTVSSLGVEASFSGSTVTSGKIAKNGTNSGKITINIIITSPQEGQITFTLNYKGTPISSAAGGISLSSEASGIGGTTGRETIKDFLSKILSIVQLKGAALQK